MESFLIGLSGSIVGSGLFLAGSWLIYRYQQKKALEVANNMLERLMVSRSAASNNVASEPRHSNLKYN